MGLDVVNIEGVILRCSWVDTERRTTQGLRAVAVASWLAMGAIDAGTSQCEVGSASEPSGPPLKVAA